MVTSLGDQFSRSVYSGAGGLRFKPLSPTIYPKQHHCISGLLLFGPGRWLIYYGTSTAHATTFQFSFSCVHNNSNAGDSSSRNFSWLADK